MLEELHAIFSGKVQGVGFRYTVRTYAETLKLKGYVKNLPNGNVELIAQGSKNELLELLRFLEEEAFPNHITDKSLDFHTPSEPFSEFKIL